MVRHNDHFASSLDLRIFYLNQGLILDPFTNFSIRESENSFPRGIKQATPCASIFTNIDPVHLCTMLSKKSLDYLFSILKV
jgi:hypothetical protein